MKISDYISKIYWIVVMIFVSIILILMPIMFLADISSIVRSGFVGRNSTTAFIGVTGLFIGISIVVPPFRKMYRKFPWLHSYIKILFVDLVILNIALIIINFGYEVQSASRHVIFLILMLLQIIICRIAMCVHFKLNPVRPIEE